MEKEKGSKTLTETISKEIINTSIDTSIDYAELGFDEIIENEVLKEIPVIKSLVSIAKIGINIKEKFFIKKLLTFLQEFHTNKIEPEKLKEFSSRFDNDPKFRSKVTEQIMVYNDAFLEISKSKILARLFKAHIEGKFDWEYFNHLSTSLNSIHPKAIILLQKLSNNNFKFSYEPEWIKNFDSVPYEEGQNLLISSGVAYDSSEYASAFYISNFGKDLFNFGIKEN